MKLLPNGKESKRTSISRGEGWKFLRELFPERKTEKEKQNCIGKMEGQREGETEGRKKGEREREGKKFLMMCSGSLFIK